MKRVIFIMLALLCVVPTVRGETAAEKEARVAAEKKAKEIARKKSEILNRIKHVERIRKGAADRLKQNEDRLTQNADAQVKAAERIAKAESSLKKALARRAELKRAYQDRANDKQLKDADLAAKKQEALNATIDLLRKVLAEDEAKLEKLQQKEFKDNELVQKQAQAMTMSQAFELAKQLEQEITESYKDIKATQTAIAHKMSFEAAQKITDVAKPERLEADQKALELKPRNKAELDKQKEAQKEVIVEADKMVEATVQMMEEAMEIVMSKDESQQSQQQQKSKQIKWLEKKDFETPSMEEKLAQMQAEADFQVQMDNAAAEDDNKKAKDLAAMMAEMNADKQQESEKQKEEDSKKAAAEVAKKMAEAQASAANSAPPPLDPKSPEILMGNVMKLTGEPDEDVLPAKWMYVSSWYVIGPFPNPNRINLRRKFPPESVVDLNATYAGKDGKMLRWQFMQAKNKNQITHWGATEYNAAEVIPDKSEEYAIYYAYAEVFFDKECDRWVAIGSDDRSDVWINDFHVWGSSNKLKGWKMNEDYRRVHFNKGRNKILLRCENGHWNLGWSFLIATGDQQQSL